ncbi:hypothetical protein HDK90DRAFT_470847 [Phyllosticta capitalensis]|uniref:Uncharacterized protein n=1 Tax=Phyllosticta capitalensis TaxID=121624 RepID=A0ABR1Y9H4_9PEZI
MNLFGKAHIEFFPGGLMSRYGLTAGDGLMLGPHTPWTRIRGTMSAVADLKYIVLSQDQQAPTELKQKLSARTSPDLSGKSDFDVHFPPCGAISEAILGQRSWDDLEVQVLVDLALAEDSADWQAYEDSCAEAAAAAFRTACRSIRAIERKMYGTQFDERVKAGDFEISGGDIPEEVIDHFLFAGRWHVKILQVGLQNPGEHS